MRFEGDTLWLTQNQIAALFERDRSVITKHIKKIFEEGELDEKSTTEFFSVVQKEGKREVSRKISHYNLDAVISVGYRVNSKKGTQFRKWATERLKQHLTQGFTINFFESDLVYLEQLAPIVQKRLITFFA